MGPRVFFDFFLSQDDPSEKIFGLKEKKRKMSFKQNKFLFWLHLYKFYFSMSMAVFVSF